MAKSKLKAKKATAAHIEHIVTGISEVISDFLRAGYGYDQIGEMIESDITAYVTEEGITELDYNKLAKAMKKTLSDEGWTMADVRFLKKFFKKNGVKFEVKL